MMNKDGRGAGRLTSRSYLVRFGFDVVEHFVPALGDRVPTDLWSGRPLSGPETAVVETGWMVYEQPARPGGGNGIDEAAEHGGPDGVVAGCGDAQGGVAP